MQIETKIILSTKLGLEIYTALVLVNGHEYKRGDFMSLQGAKTATKAITNKLLRG
jgi:hypothetical protein